MREIKFRAWDGKKMQYDVFPTSNNTVGRWVETGGGIELRFCDSGGTKVDIMQFTGLKDKKQECYGGDIIKIKDDGTSKGIVVWNDKTARWDWECSEEDRCITIDVGRHICLWEILDVQYRWQGKIIGNIHQPVEQDNGI